MELPKLMRPCALACLFGLLSACSSMAAQRAKLGNQIRRDVLAVPLLANRPTFTRTLSAIQMVRREDFVPRGVRRDAYAERPQAIGYGQTISDPYIVAVMTAAAEIGPGSRVLEIGTGSGYQAAVLSRLAREVYSIEIVDPLAKAAALRMKRLGYDNVHVRSGDGFFGWTDKAPFDAILVTAGAEQPPPELLAQLTPGGRLIMPIGPSTVQERLMVFRKATDGSTSRCVLGEAMFVPLTGRGARPRGLMGLEERGLEYCYGADLGRWDFQLRAARR